MFPAIDRLVPLEVDLGDLVVLEHRDALLADVDGDDQLAWREAAVPGSRGSPARGACLAAAFALRSTRLLLGARRLLLGAVRRSLAGLATASATAASTAAAFLGLGGIARFRRRGRYRLFGLGFGPLGADSGSDGRARRRNH